MPRFQSLGNSESWTDILTQWLDVFKQCFAFQPKTKSINGKYYQIVKTLGEGGFGFVFLVRDNRQQYALKSIRIQLPEHEQRLRQEIANHAKVNSPYVLQLLDFELVKQSGRVVEGRLLLPYFPRGTLQDLIDKGPLDLLQILKFGVDICKGLQEFHKLNPPYAFRDLKPANILIHEDGHCVLMDLGSVSEARVKISTRKEAIALAEWCQETVTAPYRAPELFDPSSDTLITEASDVWALGCTLYCMAFQESPFDGSLTATIGAQLRFPNEKYGPHFKGLIQGILQTSNKQRPSVAQIQSMLERMASL